MKHLLEATLLGLLAASPASANVISTSGLYEIAGGGEDQPNQHLVFSFTGGLIGPSPPRFDATDPAAFVPYSAGISVTVDGSYPFYTGFNNCSGPLFCFQRTHSDYFFVYYTSTSDIFDIQISAFGNWPNDYALVVTGRDLAPVAASVPELSTWALILLGFAALGFARKSAGHRSLQ